MKNILNNLFPSLKGTSVGSQEIRDVRAPPSSYPVRGLTQQETELEKKMTMVVAVVTTPRYQALTPC